MEIGTPVRVDELANGIVVSTIRDRFGYETAVFATDGDTIEATIRAFEHGESMRIHCEMVEKYDR